jgi:hypothetical protein
MLKGDVLSIPHSSKHYLRLKIAKAHLIFSLV